MHKMTAANLRNAFGGGSMGHMRYKVWGGKATEEGFSNVGRLFRAISRAEQAHATNHFRELENEPGDRLCASMAVFGIGSTSDNLQGGVDGETCELTEMYPVYLETANFQEESGAQLSFSYALTAERIHAELFTRAKVSVDSGKDVELGPVHICPVCGWTHEGDAPEICPVCGASRSILETFSSQAQVE